MFANDDRVRLGVVPRLFFLRAREDDPPVAQIEAFLAPFPLPIFVTANAMVAGDRWGDRMADQLDDATHVYVFWGGHAARAQSVALEADRALGAGQVVIPVRIDATELPRHLAASKCIDVRFVAGVNGEHYDGGFTSSCVLEGKRRLRGLGVPIDQILGESPWPRDPELRPDGYVQTDLRLVAIALCAAVR